MNIESWLNILSNLCEKYKYFLSIHNIILDLTYLRNVIQSINFEINLSSLFWIILF